MKQISYIALAMLAVSCGSSTPYDAQGTFEATEVVVSSEATGRILDFNVEEGMPVTEGAVVGEIGQPATPFTAQATFGATLGPHKQPSRHPGAGSVTA